MMSATAIVVTPPPVLVATERLAMVRCRHTFTLTFQRGELALLEVRGATDQHAAYAIAVSAFRHCQYSIDNGDQTNGQAQYFYLWSCHEPEQQEPEGGQHNDAA